MATKFRFLWRALAVVALGAPLIMVLAVGRSTADSNQADSEKWFAKMATVMTYPRCINCHTEDQFPHQSDDHHRHAGHVVRSSIERGTGGTGAGAGAGAVPCRICHQAANSEDGTVPGAPNWSFAPQSLGWDRITPNEICRRVSNPATNGGRDAKELVEHFTTDPIVQWAFDPGGTRTKPPLTQAEFHDAVRKWVDAGMLCPAGP